MRRVSITWHNNKDKKHITTIIKDYVNHNKTHPLLWPRKNQLRIHPSKDSRKLREPVWRPKRPQNASKNPEKQLRNPLNQTFLGGGVVRIVLPSPKSADSPKSDIVCKSYGQNSAAPPKSNRSSGRSLFLAAPLIKQLHTNCTDEPAYSITSDHNLKQLQIESQD